MCWGVGVNEIEREREIDETLSAKRFQSKNIFVSRFLTRDIFGAIFRTDSSGSNVRMTQNGDQGDLWIIL